ncbi:MAG: HAMP domain-containing protein [Candidatus Omnitrophica bacterium]|nr:HAMP domain-containing protein [Candidatus Omnitrophota bacterium]
MKIKIKFMLTISVILLVGTVVMMFWVGFISYNNALDEALKGVSRLSSSVHDAAHEFMNAGRQENLDAYLEKARKFDSVTEVRVIRSPLLEKELGVKNGARVRDSIDLQVLANGKEVNTQTMAGDHRAVRRVIPIITERSCMACHPDFREGSVMAGLSMTIIYQHTLDRMLRTLWSIGLIQVIFIFLVIGAIFLLFNKLIMRPLLRIGLFVDKMGAGDLTTQIKIRPDDGRSAQELPQQSISRETGMNSRDEMGALAVAVNRMSEDLQKTMVSRDRLLGEIEERKRAEGELSRAYIQLKDAQDQLVQIEKMAMIGQLAAGVAHEINNPTAFVMCNLEVLNKYLSSLSQIIEKHHEAEAVLSQGHPPEVERILQELKKHEEALDVAYILEDSKRLVQESLDGSRRIKKIVMDLKIFSHAGHEQMEYAKIEDMIQSALSIIWNEIKYKVEVVKEFTALPPFLCYPQPLSQVFINLLMNAAQAIETRGKITIKGYVDGHDIVLEFIDTGCGIPPEITGHIFEPFFTTKPVGQGTGLGLSISYDIIRQHQGHISVKSCVGEGSTFTVRLPLTDPH